MISTENSAVGSFINMYHIAAVEVYCEISCVEYSCHEIEKVLRNNLIDVIGKVLCCNADQSIGTALLCKGTCHMAIWYGCHPLMLTHSQTRMLCKVDFHKICFTGNSCHQFAV